MSSKTLDQYKDYDTLREFAEAQHTTIGQLSKKIQRLEEERNHLKSLLESSVPLIKTTDENISKVFENDAEYICHIEIAKLKEVSKVTELTLEQSRRLDTYFKILTQIEFRSEKKEEKEVEKLETPELLKLIENDNGNK